MCACGVSMAMLCQLCEKYASQLSTQLSEEATQQFPAETPGAKMVRSCLDDLSAFVDKATRQSQVRRSVRPLADGVQMGGVVGQRREKCPSQAVALCHVAYVCDTSRGWAWSLTLVHSPRSVNWWPCYHRGCGRS